MQQTGIVTKILPRNIAEIEVVRQSACGHDCSKCGGGCLEVSGRITAQAHNLIDAKVGDRVQIEGETKKVFRAALIVYIVPFVLLFLAYGIAKQYGFTENMSILCGGGGFVMGVLLSIAYNHKIHREQSIAFVITKRFE